MSKFPKPLREAAGDTWYGLRRLARFVRKVVGVAPAGPMSRDVWQWTGRKYQIRSYLLLLLNAALFVGLGCFTFWLRTGEYTPFVTGQYRELLWQAFDFTREQQITLIDYLIYPISVEQVPLMMVIVGLVLASLTAIPILVSMLYRFPFSLIFTLIIGFVAVLPWLAVTVTICCYLARWRPLRFSFRYATALVALLPVILYYILATRTASSITHLPPVQMAELYVPWVLALIAACAVMGIVLMIAKMVNDRPGAIAPLLAVMFAIPVVLFEAHVGRDELYYRLLEANFGPGSKTHFVDHVDARPAVRQIAERRLQDTDDPLATLESVMKQVRLALQFQLATIRAEREQVTTVISESFVLQQYEAALACEKFEERFPDSRYVPNTLYIQGRSLDMRMDREFFSHTLILRHYQDFPSMASKDAWRKLQKGYPDSPLASVAAFRLSILQARQGKVDRAIGLLDELIDRQGNVEEEKSLAAEPSGWQFFWAKDPASDSLDVNPAVIVQESRKFQNLLVNNRDPQYKDLPLRKLLSFDPRHVMYRSNLARLLAEIADAYPQSQLGDNIELLLATTEPSRSLKIGKLKLCIDKFLGDPQSDALPRARFELGAAYQLDNRPEEARAIFEQVVNLHADSSWALEAKRRLAGMGVSGRTGS